MNLIQTTIIEEIKKICTQIALLTEDEQIDTINCIKKELHSISPFKNEPVDCVIWIKTDTIEANNYNPNGVAPPEMQLLERSIKEDGFTQPIVSYRLSELIKDLLINGKTKTEIMTELCISEEKFDKFYNLIDGREVVDGFHRNRVAKESKVIKNRLKGYLPVVTIKDDKRNLSNRMASTIRHNRARGTHSIDLMVDIVKELTDIGMSSEWICKNIGMDPDELLRLKQISGLASLFQNKDFSTAWIPVNDNTDNR